MSNDRDPAALFSLINSFTQGGLPLSAMTGTKQEMHVVILTGCLLANPQIAASLEAEELVDAAITYSNLIQERLGKYNQSKLHNLEKLLDK
jgi:hypothetical protein